MNQGVATILHKTICLDMICIPPHVHTYTLYNKGISCGAYTDCSRQINDIESKKQQPFLTGIYFLDMMYNPTKISSKYLKMQGFSLNIQSREIIQARRVNHSCM